MVARRIRETLRVRGATDRAVEHRRDLRRSTKGHLMPISEAQARLVKSRRGWAWHGRQGGARRGRAWRGLAGEAG